MDPEDEENQTRLNLMIPDNEETKDKINAQTDGDIEEEKAPTEKDAFDEQLKLMGGDNKEETEALLGELDDKMKEVDSLMEEEKKNQ